MSAAQVCQCRTIARNRCKACNARSGHAPRVTGDRRIRAAATDDNSETLADPGWLPEVGKTAPDPSYPGAHAVISAAAAEVLRSFFGRDHFDFDVTSEVLPGAVRSFPTFSAPAEEATLSRIFAGQHFRFDLTTGNRLGREVADSVIDNLLGAPERDEIR